MTLTKWRKRITELKRDIDVAETVASNARCAYDEFLKDTTGFAPREIATIEGTVEMICRVIEMKGKKK